MDCRSVICLLFCLRIRAGAKHLLGCSQGRSQVATNRRPICPDRAGHDRQRCEAAICVFAPDFEAHTLNGEISSFKQSVAYSTAAFDQVKEDIAISNTLLDVKSCGPAMLKVTVLQQWSRRQASHGKLRLYQTVTVQDETWVFLESEWNGSWLRIFVPELGWLISREWIRQSPSILRLLPLIPTD